jgi:hypothetical protein
MTMTKTCVKAGTAARGRTGGGAAGVGAGVVAAAAGVAVGEGVGLGVSVGVGVADGEVALVDLAGVCPSTIAVGTAITAAAPTPMRAVRRPTNRMTRLTRSGSPSCGLHVA